MRLQTIIFLTIVLELAGASIMTVFPAAYFVWALCNGQLVAVTLALGLFVVGAWLIMPKAVEDFKEWRRCVKEERKS